MKPTRAIGAVLWVVLLLSSATAAPKGSAADAVGLMDTIERQVILPPGAYPLERYSRAYSYLDDGTVIGIYVAGRELHGPGRIWVKPSQLPQISDGGCAIVTVFFDPRAHRVTGAQCNGVA